MPVIRIVAFTSILRAFSRRPQRLEGAFGDQPMIGRLVPQLYGRGGMILGDQTGRVME